MCHARGPCQAAQVLILLRHGRTAQNAESRIQGRSDSPLDEVGIVQARRAGEYIRDRWAIDSVVTSSLLRSRETAEFAGFGADMCRIDDRWREIGFGEFEGRKLDEVVEDLGVRWHADIGYHPEGGESLASLHARVAEACIEVTERAANENILVVSHATPIKSAVIWATGGHASMILNLWVNPGSVSVLDRRGGNVVLAEFNRQIDDRQ
jgi:broad specificity phosphatase PhoE